MGLIDNFGFLPVKLKFDSADYAIYPVDNFDELEKDVKKYVNKDGFIYPPQIYSAKLDPVTLQEISKIPNSERPAHLFRMPASHNIEVKRDDPRNKEDMRRTSFSFIMHILGYVYGMRLQFCDWWFDGRIAFEGQHNITVSEEKLRKFLEYSLNSFKDWEDSNKSFFINILYMHNRSPSYEWDWERFAIEYMVFDACWKFSQLPKVPHAKRIERICERYSLHYDETEVGRIVGLRNDLFHEALWSNNQPGTAAESQDFMASYNLRRLNHRIIPALLGYVSSYVKSNWTSIGCCTFD
jgi:hypothetical protein